MKRYLIIAILLAGCAHEPVVQKVEYPQFIGYRIHDGYYAEYFKRENGTYFIRYKLKSGVVKEMDMYQP